MFGRWVARFLKLRKRAVVESAEGVLLLFCVLLPVWEKWSRAASFRLDFKIRLLFCFASYLSPWSWFLRTLLLVLSLLLLLASEMVKLGSRPSAVILKEKKRVIYNSASDSYSPAANSDNHPASFWSSILLLAFPTVYTKKVKKFWNLKFLERVKKIPIATAKLKIFEIAARRNFLLTFWECQ